MGHPMLASVRRHGVRFMLDGVVSVSLAISDNSRERKTNRVKLAC